MMQRLVVALGLTLSAGACSSNQCDLDDDLRLFAGDGAIDCGTAGVKTDRAAVDKCVADAFDAGSAFMARYEQTGTDSKLITAVASNSVGKVKIFRWDSAPSGGSGSPVTDVQSCETPSLKMQTSDDPNVLPIACETLGLPERICN